MKKVCALVLAIVLLIALTACGGGSSIVGTWVSNDGGDVLIFERNGTCSVPFTYDAGWWESCDRYFVDGKGTLVLSSSKGNIDAKRYRRAKDPNDVRQNGGYCISGKTLVIFDYRTLRVYVYTKA